MSDKRNLGKIDCLSFQILEPKSSIDSNPNFDTMIHSHPKIHGFRLDFWVGL